MNLQSEVVITSAIPVLGQLIKEKVFSYYVQHWIISGYHWDGDCLCTAELIRGVQINVHSLDISKNLIVQKLKELNI